jgi:hypothetical protein
MGSAYFGGDASLLVGRSNFNFNETFGTPYAISGSRSNVIVPEVGLKIGAKYDYPLACSHLIFDAGYLVINYFDPLHLSNNFDATESSFALNGWYGGIRWLF